LLGEKLDGQLSLEASLIGSSADQPERRITRPNQVAAFQHPCSKKIAGQDENKVYGLGRVGANQKAAEEIQGALPANQQQGREK
jgi:hypothetical protein